MFKMNQTSKMSNKQFGVGSVVSASKSETWLVIMSNTPNIVMLVCLHTMKIVSSGMKVEDVNYFTENECRDLMLLLKNNNTFSDYKLDAKGLKICHD